jgi:hypothetical protein
MHYKESNIMNYDEKAVVKIDGEGDVVKCAKGLTGGECGFKAGAKVCGKCGAMAVQVKMVPVDDEMGYMDEEDMAEQKKMMRRRKAAAMGMMDDEGDEADMGMMDDEETEMNMPKKGYGRGVMRYKLDEEDMAEGPEDGMDDEEDLLEGDEEELQKSMMRGRKAAAMNMTDEEDMADESDYSDEEELEKSMMRRRKAAAMNMADEENMSDESDYMDEEEDMSPVPARGGAMTGRPDMEAMRMARLRKLGTKSADVGINGYLCAIDRKVYPGATSVCDDCPGGCMAEKGMPGLLHVEGLAEHMFKGDVVDSGYSQEADMFVIDVQTKSGHINEVFLDGTNGEVLGFHRLDDNVFEQKSIMDEVRIIDFNEAAEIAVKSLPGNVIAVEPGVFEGFDAYQVEVEGLDGKSYDIFVSLDGETLGWDKWESDETPDIEAEAAEIALKRAFSDDKRQAMAEEGTAMPDGSFPIASETDLRNAVMAHGRAKNPSAAKAHIKKRAAKMSAEHMLPDSWKSEEMSDEMPEEAPEDKLEEKSDPSNDFIKSLVEFEMLAAEVDTTENK